MPTIGLTNDIEVKFQSAVELVRSLPQKGPFQPSYNDASKVYGYYKQAKFGPCSHSRPAFWDVVGRAKWDAWNVLADMPKHEAMENYVNEIKKLFERLTTKEEFQETQTNFSHVIIPFCESNGIELPAAIAGYRKAEKKKKEKKKVEDSFKKSNGVANGHLIESDKRRKDILVEIKGDDVKLVTGNADNMIMDQNGSTDNVSGHAFGDQEHLTSIQSGNDEGKDLAPEAVSMQVSSYIDAESSDDDDLYCDSINPDQISVPVQYDKPAFDEIQSQSNTEKELLISADNTSLLMSDVNFISDENGPDLQHTNSTPVVKMRPLTANGSGKENNTDLSTLSSISCDLNGEHEASGSLGKATAGGLEDELKHEFESKLPRHGRRSRNRNRTRDRREQHQSDVLGKRNLVVGARGNSQTDLAGSAGGSGERRDTGGVEQHEADPSRPAAGQASQRTRRTKADSSSDSNHSTGSSIASGETIGEQIVKALGRLEHDMRLVLRRLDSIENRISAVSDAVNRRPWWAAYLPSRRYMFLLLWPILIHILFAFWRRRRRK